jgi:hypothetical protein
MLRRVNVFGQPLSYDVGVVYVSGKPVDRAQPIKEGDDVSQPTKDTAVKYAEDLTHGVEGGPSNANEFPITASASSVPLRLETPDGHTPPLSVNPNPGNQYVEASSHMAQSLESYSNSALSDNEAHRRPYADFIKKGKTVDGEVSGNRVLSNGTDGTPHPKVASLYVSPILQNNRFSSDKTMKSIVGNDKKFNPEHPPLGFGSYKSYSKLGTDLSDGVLVQVGPMLSLRATKELNSISSKAYDDGPDGAAAKASSLLPGLAQVGAARVDVNDLQVESVLQAIVAGGPDPTNISTDSGPLRRAKIIDFNTSYGQMNNVLEQFSGLLPLGMIAAGAAMAITLNVALRVVLALFMLISNASKSNSIKRDELGSFIPGDSRYNPAFQKVSFPPIPIPAKLLGLQETKNPYGDAVGEGIKVFFGGNIGGSLLRVLESPGFYSTFCRSVIRSAADLALVLKDVGHGDPIQIAENIIGLVDAIKSSKVVAVMNVFAQIGDVSLSQSERLKRFSPTAQRTSDSEIDNLEGLDAMRSRKNGSLALAWGASTTPSQLILPNDVARAMMTTRPDALPGVMSERTNIKTAQVSRLKAEVVDVIEEQLDAEYVPFYFHDLRTNEIVSFQAFLGNLTEDFTANYENIDGYGRVDSIKLYRGTNRKIGVQFYVAATNQEDFDAMWLKVNKLTTLVYPQWSEGTLLNLSNKNKFIQPFSQIPTASPLCRVRVGDLWTSNYSKFSLARIFGLGSDKTFQLGSQQIKTDNDVSAAVKKILEKIESTNSRLPDKSIWALEPGDYEASTDDGVGSAALGALAGIGSLVGVGSPNARVVAKIRVLTKVKIEKPLNSNYDAYCVTLDQQNSFNLPKSVRETKFLVSRSHLSICDDTLKSMGIEFGTTDPTTSLNSKQQQTNEVVNLAQFFSAENNAVVAGFEAAKGRGVACVIDSMSFDWNNVPWETIVGGSRAPKMCKITMTMSVIHDIAPGLDSNGFNRAPVYTVGRQSNAIAGKDPNSVDLVTSTNKVRKTLI